jgi:hypothetical protein
MEVSEKLSKARELSIKKAILCLKNKKAPNDLIKTYSDFLRHRNILQSYSFNPSVLDDLLELATKMWTGNRRINRHALLTHISAFLRKAVKFSDNRPWNTVYEINTQLNADTKERIFILSKTVFENPGFITHTQLEESKIICNRIMMNLSFSSEGQIWLCRHAFQSKYLLNRVLRYPEKSSIISAWAIENYTHPMVRSRRAEQLAWVLNEDNNHEVTINTLKDDFEHLNELDRKAILAYSDEHEANKLLIKDFSDFLPRAPKPFDLFDEGMNWEQNETVASEPELNLTRRFYEIERKFVKIQDRTQYIPDFEASRIRFFSEVEFIRNLTMVWAICYSRLPQQKKLLLYKKYYAPDLQQSLIHAGNQSRDIVLLRWLLKNLEVGKK